MITSFPTAATAIRAVILAALSVAMLALSAPAGQAGRRIALVIGNSDYRFTSPLSNPRNDAALMTRTLSAAGFDVTAIQDGDFRAMKRAFLEFGRALQGEGIEAGLFYYAGHGVQVNGENYLVPVDARIANEDEVDLEAININDFLRVMNASDSGINIVVLDACRNNPFARSFRSISRGLAPVDAPKGTLVAYATAPGDVALDGKGGNSPYTLALSDAIGRGAGRTIEAVFKTARREVLRATDDRQVPWEVSSVTGDFYFHPGAVPAGAPATLASDFERARQSGDRAAWESFVAAHGDEAGDFYVGLAREALAALAPGGAGIPSAAPGPNPGPLSPPQQEAAPPASRDPAPPRAVHCSDVSLGAIGARLCASSVLSPQSGNRYGAANLVDDKDATAWVEGVEGDGIGESITLEFDRPEAISQITLVNGYAKSPDTYRKNGRVKDLMVRLSNGYEQVLRLADDGRPQTLSLPRADEIRWISLTISSVYRGSRYRDTAISALRVR
jgi:uncharacterized caspase-like protein